MHVRGVQVSLDDLKIVKKRKRVCVACKAFVAECFAPVDGEALPMCWLCAHHVVDHETPLHEAAEARCECTPDQVYPASVIRERAIQLAHAKLRGFVPMRELLEDYMSRVRDSGPSDRRDRSKKC